MTELIHHKKNCSAEKRLKQIATRITMRPRALAASSWLAPWSTTV
ncbi:MAG TPA: hypothetical protein P5013_07670 [Methanoregula sp.]|nr:hypothetical protein [Methanoregula sp.]